MKRQIFFYTCIATSFLNLTAMQQIATESDSIAQINHAALFGTLSELENCFKESPKLNLNQVATCPQSLFDVIFLAQEPGLREASPLWWATQSDTEPTEKINLLTENGADLSTVDSQNLFNPFWAAFARHEGERSRLSHQVVMTMLTLFLREKTIRDKDNNTVLMRTARIADPRLMADIMHTFKQTPQQLDLYARNNKLRTAFDIATTTLYTNTWPRGLRCLENFFPASLFRANQRACQTLLEQASGSDKKED
jgi:hypothetical protein